jgi:hypothetical protein
MRHSLSGQGLVLTDADAAEARRILEALEAEHRATTETGRILVRRMAVHAATMARCRRYLDACRAERVRNALAAYDDRRLAGVEKDFDWLAGQPATSARRLHQSPEGLDLLIQATEALIGDLSDPAGVRWSHFHTQRAANLRGQRDDGVPYTRLNTLCRAMMDDDTRLESHERAEADLIACKARLAAELVELLAAQVAELREELEHFDATALERDRAEAAERALFDPSPEATLARKYEAAAERGFYRALKELREVEAAAARRESDVSEDDAADCAPLGSFLPAPVAAPAPAEPEPEPAPEPAAEAPAPRAFSQVNVRILPSFTREAGSGRPTQRSDRVPGVLVAVSSPRTG